MTKQKKITKSIVARVIMLFIVIVLIIYLIYNTVRLVNSPTDNFVVEYGTLDLSETATAYIIRDEKILQGDNYMNGMEKVVTEGKRVARGDAVFRYYVNGEETIKNEISELDKKIAEAQRSEKGIYTTDISVLKNKIKELENKIYESNNIEEINNYKKEIEDYTYKISTIVGELSPSGSYLKELIDQKNNYLGQLTNGAEEIKTDYSGTVSYRIDNLEEVLTTENFDYLNSGFLEDLNLKSGEIIETSNEKGKVITEFYTYLAIVMDSDAAMNANVGDKLKIHISSDQIVNAEIVHINEENKKRVIVFKINDLPEKLINYRKIVVDVVWWEDHGLKIPNTSIINENGKTYITKNRADTKVKVLVKVLRNNDAYSIVDNYTTQELQEMGYSLEEIQNMYSIKQYDRIEVKGRK